MQFTTSLSALQLREILQKQYVHVHPNVEMIDGSEENVLIFHFKEEDVFLQQEVHFTKENEFTTRLFIGANELENNLKERLFTWKEETVAEAYNRFLVLQLEKLVVATENYLPPR